MPFFLPRVQQLEEENTDLRTTVARLKSQTEKLDEVSSWSQQDAGFMKRWQSGLDPSLRSTEVFPCREEVIPAFRRWRRKGHPLLHHEL